MEDLFADRIKNLEALERRTLQLETQAEDVVIQIENLRAKHEVNKKFLKELLDVGRVTNHFSSIEDPGPIADMVRSEKRLFMELVVLVTNNRNAANREAEALAPQLQALLTDLEELKVEQRKKRAELDQLAEVIMKQQVNEEDNGLGEDL